MTNENLKHKVPSSVTEVKKNTFIIFEKHIDKHIAALYLTYLFKLFLFPVSKSEIILKTPLNAEDYL